MITISQFWLGFGAGMLMVIGVSVLVTGIQVVMGCG